MDERHGLPSASKFELIALCPGQPQLERAVHDLIPPQTSDEYQERGLRIHSAREFQDELFLVDDEEVAIYRRGVESEGRELDRWKTEFAVAGYTMKNEERLWLHWPDGERATSARLDVVYVADSHCLVVEWKSLWCRKLTPAERNYQGAVQAVCCKVHHGATHVRVVFNKAMFGRGDVVDYDTEALERAERMVFDKLWLTQQPGAATNAGEWCYYCPCKPFCPSASAYGLLPSVVSGALVPTKKEDVRDMVSRLNVADWVYIWERSATIRNILESTTECLKKLNADELAKFGLRIGEGKALDPISDVEGAFKFLEQELPASAIWSATKLSKTDIIDALVTGKGMTKKDAGLWLKSKLEPFMEKKRSEGSVERV